MRALPHLLLPALCLLAPLSPSAEEVFRDREFAGGFNLSATNSTAKPLELGVILQNSTGVRSEWRLAQWGTQYNLKDATPKTLPDGTRVIRNAGKSVKIFAGGLTGEGIILSVNGGAEFGGGLRKDKQPWPHLLLEQQTPKDFRLSQVASLAFKLDFRVEGCKSAVEVALDPALHTAHITAYWTLHNRNAASPDNGQMIWFGVPLFDARHEIPPGHQAVDTAVENGKFICTIEGKRFYDRPTGDGRWQKIDCDLIPLMKEALAASQAQSFLTHTKFDDLQVTSFNLGWEVPGPYDCEITLKNLSLDRKAL
jgi:hypothetical protein